ncbi:uncharacterized protein THITE_156041 [Thermothielavioides terrestris NRRL 8126]|uniref:Uncharacterized protein n=1 Tax=Thermothielavioides terrestris (strain ATCC 38088 / NRRL 8126) TaxID=578455 RepID=G2RC80_THETT|nr:uncharacterized protein THITE_156041 [Thermothielavioides terrestris NRRL 8126]AEO69401.1 hypothetical protein THITE_156041 [Thermothielavioides terrestris NRRL 8126]
MLSGALLLALLPVMALASPVPPTFYGFGCSAGDTYCNFKFKFNRAFDHGPGPEALASAACHRLESIALPAVAAYASLTEENWSQSYWLPAARVAVPTGAAEVGHAPSPYDASINAQPVLIALDKVFHVAYNPATTLVTLGAG